jgi:hypothetical protein
VPLPWSRSSWAPRGKLGRAEHEPAHIRSQLAYAARFSIRSTIETLDKELIRFLEDLFDGDDHLPDTQKMNLTIEDMAHQLSIFSKQKLFLHLRAQQRELAMFRSCEGKCRELLSRLIVLSRAERPGILNDECRQLLTDCGAHIRDNRPLSTPTELDIVTNYHIKKIMGLREDLLNELES